LRRKTVVRYRAVELVEGAPVQFLAIYATRWPYDSGVEPTVGFIEDDDDNISVSVHNERMSELGRTLDNAMQDAAEMEERIKELEGQVKFESFWHEEYKKKYHFLESDRVKELEGKLQSAKWLMQFVEEAWNNRWDAIDDGSLPILDQRMEQIREFLKEQNG
jgi:hypothetical protein